MYLYCLKCRVKQVASNPEISVTNTRRRVVGTCSVCETKMGQYVSANDTLETLEERYSTPAVAEKKVPSKAPAQKAPARKKAVKAVVKEESDSGHESEEEETPTKKVVKRVVRRKKVAEEKPKTVVKRVVKRVVKKESSEEPSEVPEVPEPPRRIVKRVRKQ